MANLFTSRVGMPSIEEIPSRIDPCLPEVTTRTARALLGALVSDGILGSDTPKGAVSPHFPLDAIEILFPET